MSFPAGYCGHLLQRGAKEQAPDKQPWSTVSVFDGFTYWNHDATPTKTDPMRKCMDWLELSQQVFSTLIEIAVMLCEV